MLINDLFDLLKDSLFEVGSFVFISLFVYIFIRDKINNSLKNKKNIFFSSLLGTIPGCGGDIMVTIFYLNKFFSPGMLVAALVATMGDGVFLIIGYNPLVFLQLSLITTTAAIIIGLVVDKLKLFKPNVDQTKSKKHPELLSEIKSSNFIINLFTKYGYWIFLVMMSFVSMLQISFILQIINKENIQLLTSILFVLIMFLVVTNFIYAGFKKICLHHFEPTCKKEKFEDLYRRFSHIIVYLGVGVIVFYFLKKYLINIKDLGTINNQILLIIFSGLIGFIPGSGSQMIISSLFLQGIIPFAALLANVMVSSGEASYLLLKNNKKNLLLINTLVWVIASILAISLKFILPN